MHWEPSETDKYIKLNPFRQYKQKKKNSVAGSFKTNMLKNSVGEM